MRFRSHKLRGVLPETLQAAFCAEEVSHAVELGCADGVLFLDFHVTDRVDVRHGVLS